MMPCHITDGPSDPEDYPETITEDPDLAYDIMRLDDLQEKENGSKKESSKESK